MDPTICAQFTDWKPRKMLRLFDFLHDKLRKEEKLDYRSVFAHFVSNYMWGTQYHIEKFEHCTEHHFKEMDKYIENTSMDKFFDWETALEHAFSYKKPFFVHSDIVRRMSFKDIYIAPVYAKSGR